MGFAPDSIRGWGHVRADTPCRSTRRALILAAAAWPALAWAGAALGQSKKPPVLIGWLSWGSRALSARNLAALKEGMAALGWKEGSNYLLEERWADGQVERLPALAEELALRRPVLIVAAPTQTARAAAKAAPRTPIVVIGGDPVSARLVASYARPGGMVTGLSTALTEITEKYLELLLAAAPKVQRVGFLFDRNGASVDSFKENMRRSVAQHSVEAQYAEVAGLAEIEPALSRLAKEGVQALVVMPGVSVATERRRILKFALAQRWPVVAGGAAWTEEGALLGYTADMPAIHRRAAYFVDRIQKGAKPADLPLEWPTKFVLVINMKTARALKLEIPRDLAAREDRVIE